MHAHGKSIRRDTVFPAFLKDLSTDLIIIVIPDLLSGFVDNTSLAFDEIVSLFNGCRTMQHIVSYTIHDGHDPTPGDGPGSDLSTYLVILLIPDYVTILVHHLMKYCLYSTVSNEHDRQETVPCCRASKWC